MEKIRKYTLPDTKFTYYEIRLKNGKEITVGKKIYFEMKKKEKEKNESSGTIK